MFYEIHWMIADKNAAAVYNLIRDGLIKNWYGDGKVSQVVDDAHKKTQSSLIKHLFQEL